MAKPSSILQVVELVKQLQETERPLRPEERELLEKWYGWGPFAKAFDPSEKGEWKEIGTQLHLLLGNEYTEASKAITTSYFTDRYLCEILWSLAIGLGFTGGRVLELGCGSGSVLAAAPRDLEMQMVGVERERFSASIAQMRLPKATIHTESLENLVITNESFDLGIGNVPFSSVHITDKEMGRKFSVHNYFIYRFAAAIREGGYAILLSSRFTLDTLDDSMREILTKMFSLVGAIRLPEGAHRAAGTDVITDILVLRRRSDFYIGKNGNAYKREGVTDEYQGESWLESNYQIFPDEPSVKINEYFEKHPEQMIGTPKLDHGMHQNNEFTLKRPEQYEYELLLAAERIVQKAHQDNICYQTLAEQSAIREDQIKRREDGWKEGSFHITDEGTLVQVQDGEVVPVSRMADELRALTMLRDAIKDLLEQERHHELADELIEPARRRLTVLYEAYVKKYGPIHRVTTSRTKKKEKKKKKSIPAHTTKEEEEPRMDEEENDDDEVQVDGEYIITRRRPLSHAQFSRDPEYPLILGLEHYDVSSGKAEKSLIFTQRINVAPERKTHANTPDEALALCLDEKGYLDFVVIAELLSVSEEQIPALMGDMIYEDTRGQWFLASEYLSGNVRAKHERAVRAALQEPERFNRNVAALAPVIPDWVPREQIRVILGAPWIEADDIATFCKELTGVHARVKYSAVTSFWEVNEKLTYRERDDVSAKAQSQWGTRRISFFDLLEKGLNKRRPVIYDIIEDTKVKNIDDTLEAEAKLEEINTKFGEWIWEDTKRGDRLERVYNELFCSTIPREYDGSYLSFPGMNPYWSKNLYPWQRSFIARGIAQRGVLCAHGVGAGKTTTEIALAMKLRQLGLITRAAVVVPGHLLEQITAEAQRLYPAANILMISSKDFTKERRKAFAARVAMNDYDFIVITHSGMGMLAVAPETERAYLNEKMQLYRQAMNDLLREEGKDAKSKRTIKNLETKLENMHQKQIQLLTKKRDEGVTFEQLAISYLIIDEVHLYKNLGLPSNIDGLQAMTSKRATDLEMKIHWLEKHNGDRPFAAGFTATPISNSMAEAYVMAWYFARNLLMDMELTTLDAFASLFILLENNLEVSPNGATFRMKTRPSRFVNLPEFMGFFLSFTDLLAPGVLDDKRPKMREYTIKIEPTQIIKDFVELLVERTDKMQRGGSDNMLSVTTDGRKLSLSPSLLQLLTDEEPKIDAVVEQIMKIYHHTRHSQYELAHLPGEFKGLQIVFCDLGTPNEKRGDQVYGILKRKLIQQGIPRHGIRFIHEAKTDEAKAQLFEACRCGDVAVVVGSTEKMGVGTNIQKIAVALHHVDATWRPDGIEQRNGRIWRPGNLHKMVAIYRYVIMRTFDAFVWQTLVRKAAFYDQLRNGKMKDREMEALGAVELSFSEVKAAATGDSLVMEHAELEMNISKLQRLYKTYVRARDDDKHNAIYQRQEIVNLQKRCAMMQEIVKRTDTSNAPGFRTRPYLPPIEKKDELSAYLLREILAHVFAGGRTSLGYWYGEPVVMKSVLKGEDGKDGFTATIMVGEYLWFDIHPSHLTEKQSWRITDNLSSLLPDIQGSLHRMADSIEKAERQAATYEQLAQTPFARKEELETMMIRKMALNKYMKKSASVTPGNKKEMEELEAMRTMLLADAPAALVEEQEEEMVFFSFDTVVETPLLVEAAPIIAVEEEAITEVPEPTGEEQAAALIAEVLAGLEEEALATPIIRLNRPTGGMDWDQMRSLMPTPRVRKKKKGTPSLEGGLWDTELLATGSRS